MADQLANPPRKRRRQSKSSRRSKAQRKADLSVRIHQYEMATGPHVPVIVDATDGQDLAHGDYFVTVEVSTRTGKKRLRIRHMCVPVKRTVNGDSGADISPNSH